MGLRLFRRIRAGADWLSCNDLPTLAAMAALAIYYAVVWGPWQGKYSGDGFFGFLYLKAIVYFHTLDMKTVAPEFFPYFGAMGPGHHMPNRCPIGPVFVWMPLYLLAVLPEWIGRLLHLIPDAPWNGQSLYQVWFTGLGTLGGVLVGWRALFRLLERHFGRQAARVGAAVAVFATPLLWYTTFQVFYQHGLAFMSVALLIEYWDRTRGSAEIKRFFWLGLIGGFGMMVRAQEVIYLFIPAGEVAYRLVRPGSASRGQWFRCGITIVLTALVAFSPQIAAWIYYTGLPTPPQAEPIRWATPFLLITLFSTRAGLFPWTPLAYACVAGLLFIRRIDSSARKMVLAVGAAFLVEIYIVAAAWVLAAGYSYGNRRLSDGAVFLGIGVAMAYVYGRKKIVIGFLAICLTWNVFLSEMMRHGKMSSSSSYPRSLASVLDHQLKAPPALVRTFEIVGYPFVQPVGWIWSLYHHVLPATFENVVGALYLEREGQWFSIMNKKLELNGENRYYAPNGLTFADTKSPGEVVGPVRLVLPMFAREPFEIQVVGQVKTGPVSARWDGTAVSAERSGKGIKLKMPSEIVAPGTNFLELDVPIGSRLEHLDFTPSSKARPQ